MRIGQFEQIPLKHHQKEILSEVLRVGARVAMPANKSKHGSPITFAKLVESLACLLRSALRASTGKNYAPARRREMFAAILGSCDRGGRHSSEVSYSRDAWQAKNHPDQTVG
jgi:hypothetical protein